MLDFQGKPWSCPSSCLKFWLPNRPSQRRVVPVAGCGMPWFSASSTSSTTQPSFAIKKHKSTKPLSNFLPLILNKHAPPHWDPCLNRSNTKPRFLGHQVMPSDAGKTTWKMKIVWPLDCWMRFWSWHDPGWRFLGPHLPNCLSLQSMQVARSMHRMHPEFK